VFVTGGKERREGGGKRWRRVELTLLESLVLDETRDNGTGLSLSDINLLDVKRVSVRVDLDCEENVERKRSIPCIERGRENSQPTIDDLADTEVDHPGCRVLVNGSRGSRLRLLRLLLLLLAIRRLSSLTLLGRLLLLLRRRLLLLLLRRGCGLSGSRGSSSGLARLGLLHLDVGLDLDNGNVVDVDGDERGGEGGGLGEGGGDEGGVLDEVEMTGEGGVGEEGGVCSLGLRGVVFSMGKEQ
jgi:hypothetical protein